MNDTDPTTTNPDFYHTLWENDDVRVLEYSDIPGQETTLHEHPNTVMVTLTGFERRLSIGGKSRDLTLPAGSAVWIPAQMHTGKNIGTSPTHTILIELKRSAESALPTELGPVIYDPAD